mgnify:CR=1 FL=1|nr:MAG TPA: hypothetical protein [Caudoviricetes sp.]
MHARETEERLYTFDINLYGRRTGKGQYVAGETSEKFLKLLKTVDAPY